MIRLGVNIDHVATVRQARQGPEPDPVSAAILAELGGCDGITLHIREDRRHTQDRDLEVLRKTVQTRLNLELALSDDVVRLALKVRPDQLTFVPEKRQEVTTEGGLDLQRQQKAMRATVAKCQRKGMIVSAFIDPDTAQVNAAVHHGFDAVELHTGRFAEAFAAKNEKRIKKEFHQLEHAMHQAVKLGLRVYAGHGLNYQNIYPLLSLAFIEEVNIGHAIVSRAVLVGMKEAVQEMKACLRRER